MFTLTLKPLGRNSNIHINMVKKFKKIKNKDLMIGAVTVLVLAVAFYFIISYSPASNLSSGSVALSIGSSDGFTDSEQGSGIKTLSIAPDCSPDSGFNKCYQYEKKYSYSGADARAYVKIQGSDLFLGKQKGGYYVGEVSIPLRFEGDKFYLYENFGTWNNLWDNIARCNEDGCQGSTKTLSQNDKYVLATPGQEYTGCPAFVAFDYDCDGDCFNDNSDDPWAWATISGGWGWTGESSCLNIKSVSCFDDADCSAGNFCDKSGAWQDWSCKVKECTVDADCSKFNEESEPFCSNGDSYKTVTSATCSQSYQCIKADTPTVNDECSFGCSENSGICNEKTPVFIIGLVLGGLILIVLIITAVVIFRKKGKKRR